MGLMDFSIQANDMYIAGLMLAFFWKVFFIIILFGTDARFCIF